MSLDIEKLLHEHTEMIEKHDKEILVLQTQTAEGKELANQRHQEIRKDLHSLRDTMPHRQDILEVGTLVKNLQGDINIIKASRAFWKSQWFYIFSALATLVTATYFLGGFSGDKEQSSVTAQEQQIEIQTLQKIVDDLPKNK
jgi:hypothetical protein